MVVVTHDRRYAPQSWVMLIPAPLGQLACRGFACGMGVMRLLLWLVCGEAALVGWVCAVGLGVRNVWYLIRNVL